LVNSHFAFETDANKRRSLEYHHVFSAGVVASTGGSGMVESLGRVIDAVQKNGLFGPLLILNMIILPRQAQDRYWKRRRFSQVDVICLNAPTLIGAVFFLLQVTSVRLFVPSLSWQMRRFRTWNLTTERLTGCCRHDAERVCARAAAPAAQLRDYSAGGAGATKRLFCAPFLVKIKTR
jgi:hypothetical protein